MLKSHRSNMSVIWAMCNRTSCAHVHEFPQRYCDYCWEGTFFSWFHTYYTHLASVRFEHSVCRGSLMVTYIMLLAWFIGYSLVHWYQHCITVHQVAKCNSWEGTLFSWLPMYITLNLLLWDLSTLCVMYHFFPLILCWILWLHISVCVY